MPSPVSEYARRKKVDYFLPMVDKNARIFDIGCSDNWFKREAATRGWTDVVGIDLVPTADIVGDVTKWREIGLQAESADAIIAFEIIEHGEFAGAFHDLLKPGGLLMATTPVPRMDPVCKVMERIGLLQRRTSPHSHLTDLRTLPGFDVVEHRVRGVVSQWAVLRRV